MVYQKYFAIDIVLLPEADFFDTCLTIHAKTKAPISLSEEGYQPHLSLVMGIATKEGLRGIKTVLDAYHDIRIPLTFSGMTGTWLVAERTPELMQLHTELMHRITPLLAQDVSGRSDMFFEHELVGEMEPSVFPWINDFASAAYDKFEPHITLGETTDLDREFPIHSTTSTLALFHLSNYNTCKKLLWNNKEL